MAVKEKNLKQVSMYLTEKSIENVEALSKMLSETNRTRVVAISLEITRTIMEHILQRDEIIFRSPDNKEKQLHFVIS